MPPDSVQPFSLHFSGEAWSQIGSLQAAHFERLQLILEHFAIRAAERLNGGAPETVEFCVPITAGAVVAECVFNDLTRTITVTHIEVWCSKSVA